MEKQQKNRKLLVTLAILTIATSSCLTGFEDCEDPREFVVNSSTLKEKEFVTLQSGVVV